MNILTKMNRRMQSLNFELDYERRIGNHDKVTEIEKELRDIESWFDEFYADEITKSISL